MKKSCLLLGMLLALPTVGAMTSCGKEPDPPGIKIQFWHCLGHDKTRELQKVVKIFNEKYYGQYWVKAENKGGDYNALHTTIMTKLTNGEMPALAMGYPDSFSEYLGLEMKDRFLLNVDDFINDEEIGYSQEEIDDFIEPFFKEGQGYQIKGTWSMPMYKSTEVMFYNAHYMYGDNAQNDKKFGKNTTYKELKAAVQNNSDIPTSKKKDAKMSDLEALKAWLEDNDGYTYDLPTTWDEAWEVSAQIRADREAEGIKDDGFFPIGYDSDANLLISQFEQAGIDYTTNKNTTWGMDHVLFNNDDAKALALDFYRHMNGKYMGEEANLKYMVTKGSNNDTYTNDLFGEGKLVMSIGSTGGSSYQINENFKVLIADVPCQADDSGNPIKKYIQQGPSICFFDNFDDEIHTGAWLFYKEMADPENNLKLALENSYDPVRNSSFETQYYADWIAKADEGLKYAVPAKTKDLRQYYFTSPVFIGSGECRTQMGYIFKYLQQTKTIDAAFDTAIGFVESKAKPQRPKN